MGKGEVPPKTAFANSVMLNLIQTNEYNHALGLDHKEWWMANHKWGFDVMRKSGHLCGAWGTHVCPLPLMVLLSCSNCLWTIDQSRESITNIQRTCRAIRKWVRVSPQIKASNSIRGLAETYHSYKVVLVILLAGALSVRGRGHQVSCEYLIPAAVDQLLQSILIWLCFSPVGFSGTKVCLT